MKNIKFANLQFVQYNVFWDGTKQPTLQFQHNNSKTQTALIAVYPTPAFHQTSKYSHNFQCWAIQQFSMKIYVYMQASTIWICACQHNIHVEMCLPKCVKFKLFADNIILIICQINLYVYYKYTKINKIIHMLPH